MNEVIIYTKTGCPYCAAAMKDYTAKGIPFKEINVTEQPEFKDKVLELTGGQRIVPVIVDGDNIQTGYGGG